MTQALAKKKPATPTKPRPFVLTPWEPGEAAILSAVGQALQFHPRIAWAERMNVGAGRLLTVDRKGNEHVSQFVRFGFPGLTDYIGQMKDGRFIACECKRRNGRLTDDQRAFLTLVRKFGGVAFVARASEDVFRMMDSV